MEGLHAPACPVSQTVHLPSPPWTGVRLTLDPAARTGCDKEENIDSSATDPVHNKRRQARAPLLRPAQTPAHGLYDYGIRRTKLIGRATPFSGTLSGGHGREKWPGARHARAE
jgi:hypothetical protein